MLLAQRQQDPKSDHILDQGIIALVLLDTKEAAMYVASCRCLLEDDIVVANNKHLQGNSWSENYQHERDFGEDLRHQRHTSLAKISEGRTDNQQERTGIVNPTFKMSVAS